MYARLRSDHRFKLVTALGGLHFTKGGWTPIPANLEQQAIDNADLVIQPESETPGQWESLAGIGLTVESLEDGPIVVDFIGDNETIEIGGNGAEDGPDSPTILAIDDITKNDIAERLQALKVGGWSMRETKQTLFDLLVANQE